MDFQYLKMRYGVFVHYVPYLTIDKQGQIVPGIDTLADQLDVKRFVQDLVDMRAEYVIFTAWHSQNNLLYPSEVMERYRPGHCSKRDLIGELAAACKENKIELLLYTHPRDGMEFSEDNKVSTGWGSGRHANGWDPNPITFDFDRWNQFLLDMYEELMIRYGKDIIGLFIDEGSPAGDSYRLVDYPKLNSMIHKIAPHVTTMQNFYGTTYGCDIGMKEFGPMWNEFKNIDGGKWPSFTIPVGTCICNNWTASSPEGISSVKYKKEDLFRYVVLEAATNTVGGGVAWAAGPYADFGWETGVKETLQYVGEQLDAREGSVKGTVPSKLFPTVSGTTIEELKWGVATTSVDGKYEYIHILKPLDGKTLSLGTPELDVQFAHPTVVNCNAAVRVELQQNQKGGVTLSFDGTLDSTDTVVRMEIIQADNREKYHYLNDTDPHIVYHGNWEYSRWERCCGDFDSDIHQTETDGDSYTVIFEGTGIELIAPANPDHGVAEIYLDNVLTARYYGYADNYTKQQVMYRCENLSRTVHQVKVVKANGKYLQLDAVKVIL